VPAAFDTVTIDRLLHVIEDDIVPKTAAGVAAGNKLFGAAILTKSHLGLVVAETNNETDNALWHGEIHAIKRFYELPREQRPDPSDCLFLCTHEPCSLCLSGITWSGFDNFSYLFSHHDSADSFAIPYDIAILKAVYAVPDPDRDAVVPGRDLYNRTNDYFDSTDLQTAISALPEVQRGPLRARVAALTDRYAGLSEIYQASKGSAGIPLP
jgi:tRNA(Arg) A34 adenosine deaminase TadA